MGPPLNKTLLLFNPTVVVQWDLMLIPFEQIISWNCSNGFPLQNIVVRARSRSNRTMSKTHAMSGSFSTGIPSQQTKRLPDDLTEPEGCIFKQNLPMRTTRITNKYQIEKAVVLDSIEPKQGTYTFTSKSSSITNTATNNNHTNRNNANASNSSSSSNNNDMNRAQAGPAHSRRSPAPGRAGSPIIYHSILYTM